MPERKQQPPDAAINEAAIWFLRLRARHLSTGEKSEFAQWLRHSPGNVSAFLLIRAVIRRTLPRRRPPGGFGRVLTRLLPAAREHTRAQLRHRALSLSYFEHVKKQYFSPKIALLSVAVFGVACWLVLHDVRPLKIAAVALSGFLLLILREWVLGYRVASGYFGNSQSDVRDFVKFITENRGDIDFTDRGGKRRPSLVTEPRRSDPATPTESARSGALSE